MQREIENLKEYQKALINATLEIYERVYKFNITKGIVDDEVTRNYLKEDGFYISENYDDIIKNASEMILEKSFRKEFVFEFSRERIETIFKKGQNLFTFEYLRDIDGKCQWYKDICHIFEVNNEIKILILIENIDIRKKYEQQVIEESKKDSFTGLMNKKSTEEEINYILKTENKNHGLFVIDIDNFKQINDENGHDFGDEVIKLVATKIKNSFREIDVVGRVGGDEFIGFLYDVKGQKNLENKAYEIIKRVSEIKYGITLSIGITVSQSGETYKDMFRRADKILYEVKKGGRNGYKIS